jgi:hypothetical protein
VKKKGEEKYLRVCTEGPLFPLKEIELWK